MAAVSAHRGLDRFMRWVTSILQVASATPEPPEFLLEWAATRLALVVIGQSVNQLFNTVVDFEQHTSVFGETGAGLDRGLAVSMVEGALQVLTRVMEIYGQFVCVAGKLDARWVVSSG